MAATRGTTTPKPLRSARDEAWIRADLGIQPFGSAALLWERVLSDEDRRRLGGDLKEAFKLRKGTAGMWAWLRGVSWRRAVVEVARALDMISESTARWLLRELGEVPDDAELAKENAIAAGHLVLVEIPREAYWDGKQVEVEWARQTASWAFLWQLCKWAKTGEGVDHTHFGELLDPGYVRKLKSHLKTKLGFPPDLIARIGRCGRGTQRLDLPAAQIRMFEQGPAGTLRECQG
jgi:hypothetical protein